MEKKHIYKTHIKCPKTYCRWNNDGKCTKDEITLVYREIQLSDGTNKIKNYDSFLECKDEYDTRD